MIKYKLHKCKKGQEANYQILEFSEGNWITCGAYYKKKDAKEDLKKLIENEKLT